MRTRFFLSAVLLLNFFWSHAQSSKGERYVDFTLGASVPLGAYGKTDVTNNTSGAANTGESIKITCTQLLNSSFGLSLAVRGQRNPLDAKALEASLSHAKFYQGVYAGSVPYPNPPQMPYSQYGNWKVDKKAWLFGSLLAGGYGQLAPQPSKNLLLTAKGMVGAVYAHAPELHAKSTSDTATVVIRQSSSSAFGFAWSLAGGVKFKYTNRIYLLAEVEYFGTSKIKFKDVKTSVTTAHFSNGMPVSASSQTTIGNGEQQIATINLNVGIGISL